MPTAAGGIWPASVLSADSFWPIDSTMSGCGIWSFEMVGALPSQPSAVSVVPMMPRSNVCDCALPWLPS